jgi:hypothetical protein
MGVVLMTEPLLVIALVGAVGIARYLAGAVIGMVLYKIGVPL